MAHTIDIYERVNENAGYMWLEEDLIGWKKVAHKGENYLIKLLIPSHTMIKREVIWPNTKWDLCFRRKNLLYDRKLRAETAMVLSIIHMESGKRVTTITNPNIHRLTYTVGEWAVPHEWSTSRLHCAGGIHFFTMKSDAKKY